MATIENSRHRYKPQRPRRVTPRDRRIRKGRKQNWRDDDIFATINWRVYDHRQLWDMIMSAQPAQLGAVAAGWRAVGHGVGVATDDVNKIVRRLRDSWRGPSAAQAATSVSALVDWADGASQTAHSVGQGLEAYSSAVERARNKMPEPVHYYAEQAFKDGYNVKTLDGPNGVYLVDALMDDHMPTKREARDAKEEAILVMKEYEATSRGVHTGLPQPFDTPPPTTTVHPDPVQRPPDEGNGQRPPLPTPDPRPPHPAPVTSTTTAAMAPVDMGYGTGQAPGSGQGPGPGTSSGPGVAGGLVGRGPGAGPGVGQGARAGVGPTAMTGSRAAGPTTGPARGAGPGSAFYPPFAGAGAAGDEDREHKNRYGDGLDLMDDLPPAFPSVLGE